MNVSTDHSCVPNICGTEDRLCLKIKQYRAPCARIKVKALPPELVLRRALRAIYHTGYRLNWKKAPGSPDICFVGKKVAIFVNGCFWHRCPKCDLPLPKTHVDYWSAKFERNTERDRCSEESLRAAGWTVITVWECEVKNDPKDVAERISIVLNH